MHEFQWNDDDIVDRPRRTGNRWTFGEFFGKGFFRKEFGILGFHGGVLRFLGLLFGFEDDKRVLSFEAGGYLYVVN